MTALPKSICQCQSYEAPFFLLALAIHSLLNPKMEPSYFGVFEFRERWHNSRTRLGSDLDRLGLLEGRDCCHASLRSQAEIASRKMTLAITEVRNQRKIGSFPHGSTASHFYTVYLLQKIGSHWGAEIRWGIELEVLIGSRVAVRRVP